MTTVKFVTHWKRDGKTFAKLFVIRENSYYICMVDYTGLDQGKLKDLSMTFADKSYNDKPMPYDKELFKDIEQKVISNVSNLSLVH